MKEKNNSRKVIIVTGILLVILLFALGYLGYIKVTSTDEKTKDSNKIINDVKNFPISNDDNVKVYDEIISMLTEEELKTNFTSIVKEKDNLKFDFSCDEYNEVTKTCDYIYVNYNNTILSTYMILYKTDKYTIAVESGGDGVDNINVYIYDLSGTLKYENKDAIRLYYNDDRQNSFHDAFPKIVNNILYMVVVDKEKMETNANPNYNYLKFGYVNLNDSEIKEKLIQKFNAYFSYES